MPTAVVDRPHSPVTEPHTASNRLAGARPEDDLATRPEDNPTTRPEDDSTTRPLTTRSMRGVVAGPSRPSCADMPQLFLDPMLESEPAPSAPVGVRRRYAALAADATEICASCPLLSACLYRAVVEFDVAGFVAGTTQRQRAKIRVRLGVEVEPEDFDTLAGVVGGQRTVDHDEVVRLRRAHPDESLERLAHRLGCSLSTVKRHLRKERNQPVADKAAAQARPTTGQVMRATAEILAENSGHRRAAA